MGDPQTAGGYRTGQWSAFTFIQAISIQLLLSLKPCLLYLGLPSQSLQSAGRAAWWFPHHSAHVPAHHLNPAPALPLHGVLTFSCGCLGSAAMQRLPRETPAGPHTALQNFKDVQPHKKESSREGFHEGRTMGKWSRNPWAFCRHSGDFTSKPSHDTVTSILHTFYENTKMQ